MAAQKDLAGKGISEKDGGSKSNFAIAPEKDLAGEGNARAEQKVAEKTVELMAEKTVEPMAETETESVPAVKAKSAIISAIEKLQVSRMTWSYQESEPRGPVKGTTHLKPNVLVNETNRHGNRLITNGPKDPAKIGNALTRAGPLGYESAPVRSWYEQTVDKEEAEKKPELKAASPFSAPGGADGMVCYRRDTQAFTLGIEDIILPLKDLYEVPIVADQPRSGGKKVKSFRDALLPRKKIINNSARKGKMIKKTHLSMIDFDLVTNAKGSKVGPDKGDRMTNGTLVGGVPPVKE
ncbi:unnamed protein product [Cochlearia groenlandica]